MKPSPLSIGTGLHSEAKSLSFGTWLHSEAKSLSFGTWLHSEAKSTIGICLHSLAWQVKQLD